MKTNTAILIAVLMVFVIVLAMYWVAMKAPKMSARDRYHSLGNQGLMGRPSGSYTEALNVDIGPNRDMLSNTIDYGQSKYVQPASYASSLRGLVHQN